MRIAFYAPMKPPSHPVPSGDRRIARLLLQALRASGHEVRVVSTFRAYEGNGDAATQGRLRRRAARVAERLLTGKLKRWRPDLWFTYHLHHKAPDWVGAAVARRLAIPYVVAEPSYAPRRARGRWDDGLAAVAASLKQADAVFLLNPNDAECVVPLVRKRPAASHMLLPFLDAQPYRRAWRRRALHRMRNARRFHVPARDPWLLAVGMMRAGDKLASYRVLARALAGMPERPWRLIVVGDGPGRDAVRKMFAPWRRRVHFLGALPARALPPLYAASDIFVWPAMNEAIGMAILEAQAAGLPAVVGDIGATGAIVAERETGRLVPVGRAAPLRRAIAQLLGRPDMRRAMSERAVAKIQRLHEIEGAARRIDAVLVTALARAKRRRRR